MFISLSIFLLVFFFSFLTENENDIYGFPSRNFLATNFDFVGFREYK